MEGSDMMDYEMEGPHQRSNNPAFPGGCPYLSNVYPQYPHPQPHMSRQPPPNQALPSNPFAHAGRDQYLPLHQSPSFFGHDRSRELPPPFHHQPPPYANSYASPSFHNRYQNPQEYPFPALGTSPSQYLPGPGVDRFPNMSNPPHPPGRDHPNPAMLNHPIPGLPRTGATRPMHSSVDDTLVTTSGQLHIPGRTSSASSTTHSPSASRIRPQRSASINRPRSGSYHPRSYAGLASSFEQSPSIEHTISQFADRVLQLRQGMDSTSDDIQEDVRAYLTSGRFDANVQLSYEVDQIHQASQPGRDLLLFINERRLARGQDVLLDVGQHQSSGPRERGAASTLDPARVSSSSLAAMTNRADHQQTILQGDLSNPNSPEHLHRFQQAITAQRAARHVAAAMSRPPGAWPESMYIQRDRGPKRASQKFIDSLPKVEISSLDEEDRTCSICYDEYGVARPEAEEPAEDPVKMPCGHVFGKLCITTWLEEHCTCPACRHKLLKVDTIYVSQMSNLRQLSQEATHRQQTEGREFYVTEMRRQQSLLHDRDPRRAARRADDEVLRDFQAQLHHEMGRQLQMQLSQRGGPSMAGYPSTHPALNPINPTSSYSNLNDSNAPAFPYRPYQGLAHQPTAAQPRGSTQSDSDYHSSNPFSLQRLPPFRPHRSPPPGPPVLSPGRSPRTLRPMHRSRGSASTRRSASSTDNIDSDISPSNASDIALSPQTSPIQNLDPNLNTIAGPFDPRLAYQIRKSQDLLE